MEAIVTVSLMINSFIVGCLVTKTLCNLNNKSIKQRNVEPIKDKLDIEQQWENLWNYDGSPQKEVRKDD